MTRNLISWTNRLRSWTDEERLRQHEDKVLLILTLIIGALVGLVVVAFILLTENLAIRMYPAGGAAWRRLLIPVLGALIGGVLLKRYFPAARGSGIPQTKAALFLQDGFISFKTTAGKFVCSSISLASGIALGREGPSVQVGAGIASVLGRRLGLSPARQKSLVPIGASAALAAAFNTPIAAVLFALEEVMGDMHAPVLGSIVLSSATSWIVMRTLLGNAPLFHVPSYQLVHPAEILGYGLLGILGGLISVLFVKLLLRLRSLFLALPQKTSIWQPAIGGLLVGVLGWFVPEVLGVGYGQVDRALNGQHALGAMILLVALKILATSSCYASGNAGGIFGPSLFIGAMLGGAFGSSVHALFPDYTGSIGAYALVGMGTAFAGIIRVPLTSVIMIFEITRDYSIIVPLMISNLLAFFISSRFQREPIYEALQHQEGIHLPSFVKQRVGLLLVNQAMRSADTVIPAQKTPSEILSSQDWQADAFPVVDAKGLVGMITKSKLEMAVREERGKLPLGELFPPPDGERLLTVDNFPHVHEDHPLDSVLRRMGEYGLNVLPVVDRSNLRKLKGIITLQDILSAFGVGDGPKRIVPTAEAQTASPFPLLAGISAILLVLLLVSGFFVYYHHAKRQAGALTAFNNGKVLTSQGRYEEAIEQFRNALSISHDREHRLALALTLEKANRLNEAEVYLKELIRDEPNSGLANLGMARLDAGRGRFQEAVTDYHRAIYGSWPPSAEENPVKVRFELINLLGNNHAQKQAISELMALVEVLRDDAASRKRIGRMLMEYGGTAESASIFKDLLRQTPRDAESLAGLGMAEFAQANYRAAQDALRSSLRINPDNPVLQNRLYMCDQIVSFDPTIRGLSSIERYRRSKTLLERTLRIIDDCLLTRTDNTPTMEIRDLAEEAQKALRRQVRFSQFGEEAESDLVLTEKLWRTREVVCSSPLTVDEALERTMARLAP